MELTVLRNRAGLLLQHYLVTSITEVVQATSDKFDRVHNVVGINDKLIMPLLPRSLSPFPSQS